jgi:hypothetical protein
MPILLSALAPMMLRTAGEQASGTILWMADERAIAGHIVPRITKAAGEAGRPQPRIVDDVMAVGGEDAILDRLCRFRDAGVTDLAARIAPLGDGAAARTQSRRRTEAVLATFIAEL